MPAWRPDHIPRLFFRSVCTANLDAASDFFSDMILQHISRYPGNRDALVVFISSHLLFAMDLSGHLDMRQGEPVEPYIEEEVDNCIFRPGITKEELQQSCRRIMMRVNPFRDSLPPEELDTAEGPELLNAGLVRTIHAYLDQHVLEPELTVTQLSRQLGFSPSYVSRVYHRVTGTKLSDYILQLRLIEANRLLRTTELPISEVAKQCGFSGSSTFIRAYSVREKITPAAYRRQLRLEPANDSPQEV